ncbi:sigma-70 family RNA polymerase sigma factor [uncultured Cellulomonas sp.]|uniref:sigma-70 family RNA polymerase sigma factor n=1 Tax=uncultured Cellulomonas sp. TaxID=189682 RepID=UPI0028EB80FD|nr:sigma-70 family RNA polymerase sigma factor [uncultured Cellulomonas sp.]
MTHWRGVLDEMVRERRSALVAYACLFVVDRRDAEDLVHEAIVRTFSRPRAVTEIHAAEGYVRQAIRTVFLDQTRSRRTWLGRAHLFEPAPSAPGAEDAASATADVGAALRVLSPRERACVVLRYFDDLPVSEIAAALLISEGAVKRYLSDGTGKLRTTLQVVEPDGPDEFESVRVSDLGRNAR